MRTHRTIGIALTALLILLAVLGGRPGVEADPLHAILDVPFLSQTALRDQRISGGQPLTLGNDPGVPLWEYGCGVASTAMVFRKFGVDTDIVRLNAALRQAGGFSGALLAWNRTDAFVRAGAPWIQGIERVNTARPQSYQPRVDAELAAGHPVIAYLGNRHYVVLAGKDEEGVYRINDPWQLTEDAGKDIPLEQNDLKLKFNDIRQFVFVYPERNAPTNAIPVSGAIAEKYFAWGGSKGSLGNPAAAAEALSGGGRWQRFQRGAILAPAQGTYVLHGPVWDKFQAEGGVAKLGLPRGDVYSYFVGPAVEWRADFADASILWTEGDRPQDARLLTAQNALRAEYFANPDLSGSPAHVRYEEDLLFDWRQGAPGPWVEPDGFSARYTATIRVGGLGWWYNFVADADEGVRVIVDGQAVLDAWTGAPGAGFKPAPGAPPSRFTRRLGAGPHTLAVEYREGSGEARLRVAWSAWPAWPVFAAEETAGPIEQLPASAAASMPDLGTPMAQATATARAVLATMTAEARVTPTPDMAVAAAAQESFETWAQAQGEPYRDVQVTVEENDGFFATVRVAAWFRPGRAAPWEEREAAIECRQVGGKWQCDRQFAFNLTAGEVARRAQATATAVAQATATAQARVAATATAIAAARATAVANMPAALRQMVDRFGLEFVYVPAGEFLMGSAEAEVDAAWEMCKQAYPDCERKYFEPELPQHKVNVDAFWIGKTEVTNAQYRPFVEAGGYTDRSLWTEAGWAWRENVTQPACWDDEQWNQPDHPVVCITWYEAVAYANWLSRETGLSVRLPTEAEWEKAARGTDGRIWPWGNEPPDGTRLNYCDKNCEFDWKDEAVDDGYQYTAPVGSYPAGASPYGALDMAGNVWEWTSTLWGGCDWPPGYGYPYRMDDGREDSEGSNCRVVRGGSFYHDEGYVRCACRLWLFPYLRLVNLGFRVVASPI